jgi:hypothetical protein
MPSPLPLPIHVALCPYCRAVNDAEAIACCKCGMQFDDAGPGLASSFGASDAPDTAANESTHAHEFDAPSPFHVVLGADGSVAIERAADVETAAAALPAEWHAAEKRVSTEPMPRPPRLALAPTRQLTWSFVGGAVAATLLLATAYQVHRWWGDSAPAWSLGGAPPAGAPHAAGMVSEGPIPGVRMADMPANLPPPAAGVAEPPPRPTEAAARLSRRGTAAPAAPAAAGTTPAAAVPTAVTGVTGLSRAAPTHPAPLPGPCTPAVAALSLCTPSGGP